jgi:hypothetical protein
MGYRGRHSGARPFSRLFLVESKCCASIDDLAAKLTRDIRAWNVGQGGN